MITFGLEVKAGPYGNETELLLLPVTWTEKQVWRRHSRYLELRPDCL